MYIKDGIAYAGEEQKPIRVCGVRPMPCHRLWVRFTTGETKIIDFNPLLEYPAFAPLKSSEVFSGVYIDYGVPVWGNGEIDIAPEYLYKIGISENIA